MLLDAPLMLLLIGAMTIFVFRVLVPAVQPAAQPSIGGLPLLLIGLLVVLLWCLVGGEMW